jgi:hypothetical protein
MHIVALGCIGLGFVWGWHIGSLRGQISQYWQARLAVIGATLLLATEVTLFANWHMLLPFLFLGAMAFSLLLHLLWRRQLHRFDYVDHLR